MAEPNTFAESAHCPRVYDIRQDAIVPILWVEWLERVEWSDKTVPAYPMLTVARAAPHKGVRGGGPL